MAEADAPRIVETMYHIVSMTNVTTVVETMYHIVSIINYTIP